MPACWVLVAQRLFAFLKFITESRACHWGTRRRLLYPSVTPAERRDTCPHSPDVISEGQCMYTQR